VKVTSRAATATRSPCRLDPPGTEWTARRTATSLTRSKFAIHESADGSRPIRVDPDDEPMAFRSRFEMWIRLVAEVGYEAPASRRGADR